MRRFGTNEPVNVLRLMTYNICRDGMGYGVKGWSRRCRGVVSLIHEHLPHIAGVQEATERQILDLDERLGEIGYSRAGARLDGDLAEHRNAIYFRRDDLSYAGREYFEIVGYRATTADGRKVGRSLNWATFRIGESQLSLTVCNVHLDASNGGWRTLSVDEIVHNEDLRGCIVLGDFNARPGSLTHRSFTRCGWRDAAEVAASRAGGDVTLHRYRPSGGARVDWVLVPARWHVISHDVLQGNSSGEAPSDHFPVLVRISFSGDLLQRAVPNVSFDGHPPRAEVEPLSTEPQPSAIFEALRMWRSEQAHARGVPAYTIAHDATLHDIARLCPRSKLELASAWGIGPYKLRHYGDEILALVRQGLTTSSPGA